MKTYARVFRASFLCVLILCLVFLSVANLTFQTVEASSFSTSAKAAIVLETSSGRKLFSKNENQKLPMASTTKIMTAITAIENCKDLDEKFEVSRKSIGVPGTSLYLREGDVYSTKDLLYALMLISGNDASVAIAEHIAGSTSEFVTMMNDLAKKIGATNSHFANTHGLDADGHYTTAYDLAKITAYALENSVFAEIVSTKNIKITNGNGENRYLKNKNKLLSTLEGCIGVKTGYTDDAGRCLVSAIEKDGMKVVAVVLNCGPMFPESAEMLSNAVENFKLYDLTQMYEFDDILPVVDGADLTAKIGTNEKFFYPLSESELKKVNFKYLLPKNLQAPMKIGEAVGKIEIFFDNDLLFSEKIFTIENVKAKTMWQRLQDFFKNW